MNHRNEPRRDKCTEGYLTVGEVAEELRVSPKKVKSLIDQEGLPAYDFGARALRVPTAEFKEWRESRRVSSEGKARREVS